MSILSAPLSTSDLLESLQSAIENGDRAAAATALGAAADTSYQHYLEPLLNDPNDAVRSAARRARQILSE